MRLKAEKKYESNPITSSARHGDRGRRSLQELHAESREKRNSKQAVGATGDLDLSKHYSNALKTPPIPPSKNDLTRSAPGALAPEEQPQTLTALRQVNPVDVDVVLCNC